MKEVTAYQSLDNRLFTEKWKAMKADFDVELESLFKELADHTTDGFIPSNLNTFFRQCLVFGFNRQIPGKEIPPYPLRRLSRKVIKLRKLLKTLESTQIAEASEQIAEESDDLPF